MNKSNEEKEALNKFKEKQSESLLKDCDSMKESAKGFSKLLDECNNFMKIELKAREAVSDFVIEKKKVSHLFSKR